MRSQPGGPGADAGAILEGLAGCAEGGGAGGAGHTREAMLAPHALGAPALRSVRGRGCELSPESCPEGLRRSRFWAPRVPSPGWPGGVGC